MTSLAISDMSCCDAAMKMYRNTPLTKNCKFVIDGVNDISLNNNQLESQSYVITLKILKDSGCRSFTDSLKMLISISDILNIAKKYFDSKQELVNRLCHLIELYDEEDISISIESLKSMLVFFDTLNGHFNNPSITLNENGTFQVNWKKDNLNFITLRFKEFSITDYLIFKPSHHIEKPIILNGSMCLFDLLTYIKDLKLIYLIKGN